MEFSKSDHTLEILMIGHLKEKQSCSEGSYGWGEEF